MRLTVIILLLFSLNSFGQSGVALIYEEMPNDSVYRLGTDVHTSVKPTIRTQNSEKGIVSLKRKSSQFGIINPLADLNYRYLNQSYYRTGAGIGIESTFKNKWYFRTNAVAGIGFGDSSFFSNAYFVKTDSLNYTYADVRGRLSYTPNDIFNFQIGLDNNFIGEGSRSLFLSDYGKPYPFGQIRAKFWRVEYSVLYQFYREQIKGQWSLKNGATHYISFNAAKWLNIGIFETVVFQPKDTLLNRGYDVEYLNPVIFYRPQEYSLGSSDNVLLGISFAAKYKSLTAYGQLILDEFFLSEIKAKTGWWANKYGGQLGIKGRFQSGKNNFFFRTEYNFVRPYTYAHLNSGQNYGNQGMTLAHPYGANFMELLGELKIQRGNWSLKSTLSFFLKGYDKDGYSYGGDLYQPYTYRPYDYNHFIGQGLGNDGFRAIVTVSYRVLKEGNLQAFIENQFRYDSAFKRSNYIPMIGLRSQLWNDYRNY